ncbi:lipase family protein [Nocardia sp. NPDC051030]|uniref:lipase family protein n=1 Tax=Nocardia sp. NPDC051030 TaxID=3155162 RepID=UPI003412A2A4
MAQAGLSGAQPELEPQPVSGQLPDSFQQWVDELIPPPALAPAVSTPLTDIGGLPDELAALRSAVMPAAIGDGFIDDWPERLEDYRDGQIVEFRDVTSAAWLVLLTPVNRVLQLKYRTTDSHGAASYGIASLVLPNGAWTGPGDRPVLVNNLPINGLGRDCNPSYNLSHGFNSKTNLADYLPPTTQLALLRGYAVLITDHEGPRMAYADPYVAGHAVLDAIRAVRYGFPEQFGDSRFAMVGYSGGAIATHGAVKLMPEYAPELEDVVVGAAMGGVPADFEILSRSMNGNLASGVFLAAVFAIGRERPEILARMNHLAQWVAVSFMKDQCSSTFGLPGLLMLSIDAVSNMPNPLHSQLAQDIFGVTKMAGKKSPVPLYIYNGEQEWWVPAEGAKNLYQEQCSLGATAVYRSVIGEHVIAAFTGYPESLVWLDQRLQGEPAPNEC